MSDKNNPNKDIDPSIERALDGIGIKKGYNNVEGKMQFMKDAGVRIARPDLSERALRRVGEQAERRRLRREAKRKKK